MFSFAVAALAASSLVSAAPVNVARNVVAERAAPATWLNATLEDYDVYHLRYTALDCRTQHNTTFFEDCCHPLHANENLTETRAPYCSPNETAIAWAEAHIAAQAAKAANASATAAQVTVTIATGADEAECTEIVVSDEEQFTEDDDAAEAWQSFTSEVAASPSAWTATTSSWTQEATAAPTPSSSSASAEAIPSAEAEVAAAWANEVEAETTAAPSTTETPAAKETPSSTSSSPKETPTAEAEEEKPSNSNSGSGFTQTGGQATFYSQAGTTGACGVKHSDSDIIVAASTDGQFYPNQNGESPYCGRQVQIRPAGKFAGQGNTITATIADACPTCHNSVNDLDLSTGAWDAMGIARSVGVVEIEWKFV